MIHATTKPMTENDLDAVTAIDQELFPLDPWSANSFRQSMRDHHCRVLRVEDEIAGCIVYSTVLDEGELLHVGIAPKWQSQGFGKALLIEMINWGNKNGIKTWFLEVRASNAKAIALYKRNGFETVAVRKNYYKTENGFEDAVIMKREVSPC